MALGVAAPYVHRDFGEEDLTIAEQFHRLANNAAFDFLAGGFSQFKLARNVLRENPRLAVELLLEQIRAMTCKAAMT